MTELSGASQPLLGDILLSHWGVTGVDPLGPQSGHGFLDHGLHPQGALQGPQSESAMTASSTHGVWHPTMETGQTQPQSMGTGLPDSGPRVAVDLAQSVAHQRGEARSQVRALGGSPHSLPLDVTVWGCSY